MQSVGASWRQGEYLSECRNSLYSLGNIMISGLGQHGCGHEAYRLCLQIKEGGFKPSAFTYSSVLKSWASAGALEWGKEVHGHARKSGLELDVRLGNSLVDMYAKGGSIDNAQLVFDRMGNRDVTTWNIMISGLAQHGCEQDALDLFRKVNADLAKPGGTTFIAVLSACSHGGLVDDGRRLFSAMTEDYRIEPDIVRSGHLEEVKRFINDMPVEPDAITWTALLGACKTYGNVVLGELVSKELFTLEPNNACTYVLLSNTYAAGGKWERVSLVRSMMEKVGIRKEPGRDWIEVDVKIHEFTSGDTSHPAAMDIKSYLKTLTEELRLKATFSRPSLCCRISMRIKNLALCSHS